MAKKNDLLKPNFYHIPSIVAEQVKPHEAFVFGVVYWFAKLKEGRCYASNQRIAEALPYPSSPLSVANALTNLEKKGFVRRVFKDKSKRIRKEVVSLVDYMVSPTDDTGITHRLNRVSPTGEQISNSNTIRENNTSAVPAQDAPLIEEVIKAFETVDPKNKNYYGNTTQRKAASFLVGEYGLDQVLRVIALLPRTNKQPYFPKIYTPWQLQDKWKQLEETLISKKTEARGTKPKML